MTRTRIARLSSLDEVADFVQHQDGVYVRWSRDIHGDLDAEVSRDELTGVELPGLSANGLAVEPWWGERPVRTWIARRLYDYRHLCDMRGPGTKPWILRGSECGRGPDNEPLLRECQLLAEIAQDAIDEATRIVDELPAEWGSLRRG